MRLTTSNHSGGGHYDATPSPLVSVARAASVGGGLLLIFALDRATTSAPVQHLYYLPIIIAGVLFGTGGGIGASLVAVVLYHLANPQLLTFRYQHWDLVQMVLFLAVGLITAKLRHDAHRLHLLAMTDDLTGLHNLRSFEGVLTEMVRVSRESSMPLALFVLDVDRLKSLNDQYGHLAGAEAVRTVGHIIAAEAPRGAVACRYGGDEFVIAIPHCSAAKAREVADGLRRAVNVMSPRLTGIQFPAGSLSVSIGVACRPYLERKEFSNDEDEVGEALFRRADEALYWAKNHGRNHVFVA
jgi:diguanylate cyclase (GGDEF)-like protein